MNIDVFHVVNGELSLVAHEKASGETGRQKFELSVGTKGEAPTILFKRQLGRLAGGDIEWAPPTTRTRKWDPAKQRFR